MSTAVGSTAEVGVNTAVEFKIAELVTSWIVEFKMADVWTADVSTLIDDVGTT